MQFFKNPIKYTCQRFKHGITPTLTNLPFVAGCTIKNKNVPTKLLLCHNLAKYQELTSGTLTKPMPSDVILFWLSVSVIGINLNLLHNVISSSITPFFM